jgi:two-component sensor histidine kinase
MLSVAAPNVEDVFITPELDRRTPGKVDSRREKIALQSLAALMVDDPKEVLPRFVSLAMELGEGISAGLSLYEEHPAPGFFRWHHLQGTLAQFTGATTPRYNSPCGVVLDLDAPVLTAHSERGYDWIAEHKVSLPEVLLVPLHIGSKEPMGTLWIVSDEKGHFHREHVRVTTELASFVAIALRMLSTEQKLQHALDEQLILAREMTHRIKNLFAMTDGMIRFTARSAATPTEMSELLSGRLHALADAHSLVRREFSELGKAAPTSDLKDLIHKVMFPHEHLTSRAGSRFSIEGPPIRCGERATNGIALIFHELATNAAKYGSLTTEKGRVEINWYHQGESLMFNWVERHGPPIEGPPSASGFGGELLRRMIREFGGSVGYDWQSCGLVAKITFPGKAVATQGP